MTLTELPARRHPTAPGPVSSFDLAAMTPWELASHIHRTDFVPAGLRGKPEAVLACFLYGHEIGVGPMESLAYIAMIDGRPTIAAQLMRARVLGAGHELWEEEATNTRVTMCGRRVGTDRVQSVTWTLDDARKAGLAGRANWTRYPRQMLEARATAQLCRLVFPDVLGASRYATEEVEGGEDAPEPAAAPQGALQAPEKRSRRRPARTIDTGSDAAVVETGEAPTAPPPEPPRPPLPGEPLESAPTPRVVFTEPGPAPLVVFGEDANPQPEVEVMPGLILMSDPQRKAMFAALRDAGIVSRDDRLAYCGEILQRPITSSAELTPGDAAAVIEAARDLARQMRLPGAEDIPPPGDPDT